MVRYVKTAKGEALAIRKALPLLCPDVDIEGMLDSSEVIERWNLHKMKGVNGVPRVRRLLSFGKVEIFVCVSDLPL